MTVSSLELAHLLGLPEPTVQQQAVIEAPLTPALVVAGAGSGKTETMANRVVWLLANNLVSPDQVLGLTFTRKAAGGLADRIARRITQLRLVQSQRPDLLSAPSRDLEQAEFDQPTVSTYNSFASALFRDNALLIGREPESALLNDASSWQLARHVVMQSTDDRLVTLGSSIDLITEKVIDLSHQLSDNVADASAVDSYAERFVAIGELPFTNGKPKTSPYASVTKAVSDIAALGPLLQLAEQYALEKRRRGLLEFSDQVALALAICRRSPATVQAYRDRYRVVLLDEYQDTSVVQTELLSSLFGGHGVMAVGDPHQSIYGWRGASAANLARFAADFGDASEYALSTSWRNATTILDAANLLVAPLSAASPVTVESLRPRPAAPTGTLTGAYFDDIVQESRAVAQWLKAELARPAEHGLPKTAAILFRQRRHMGLFARALEELRIPHHILGLGGLLSTPEIVDLVSALRVIHDPTAGSELIRLLSGARWAIGPHDLKALAAVAGWLHSRHWSQGALSDEVKQRMRDSVAIDDGRSIVDALDFVGEAPAGHGQLAGFSELGLERLRAAARQLAFFRSRVGLALPDLVRLIEQELMLDIEVIANESSGLGAANLYAFRDELAGFLAADEQATLGAFLGWLARAERDDTMGPRSEDAERGTVQLLTIHGAKGLEWEVVAVPRMTADELPAASREGTGWIRVGQLPFEFRGDARELPRLDWQALENQAEFDAALKIFKSELAARHQAEERRLGYVAVTRAQDSLLLTGAFWGGQGKPRPPGAFLAELARAGLIDELPTESAFEDNPLMGEAEIEQWPLDPLGNRRRVVERAAALVTAEAENPRPAGVWQHDLDLLLAERDAAARSAAVVPLPERIPASRFKDFVTDPSGVARALRRPMPEKPYRATRLGTRFHGWVEARYGASSPSELVDASLSELDFEQQGDDLDLVELERLKGIFEKSRWAALRPVDVEIEIHLPFDARIVICKIDAVYATDDGRFEIVDWKTGKAPSDAKDLEQKQLQLALYRLAYARFKGIDPSLIDAVFFYVSDDAIIRPERLFDEAQLLASWRGAIAPAGS
ncbi:ATP-dependent DNA helicase [Salinibacterium sp. G-O1]|uniref:ATP-dependent helicase n=1 Tax=Salinibacterium sp. G-O1 TaxID=3046208 RepID=UPI0024BAD4C6|nr:ATP-dependent DNA helicase [Salinibacterium sp. G-O1]MDJ0334513.1 ATP-dependent DNA helicase [Salinibacterium sp. G-O1]